MMSILAGIQRSHLRSVRLVAVVLLVYGAADATDPDDRSLSVAAKLRLHATQTASACVCARNGCLCRDAALE